MKKQKQHNVNKTNAIRILEQRGIKYQATEYEYDESDLSGVHAAQVMDLPENEIFKTLVTRSQGGKGKKVPGSQESDILVFIIPVAETLDLKKAAKAAGRKKVEMIHVREIEDLTGYIRGGCSPIGMKKAYPTFLDESAGLLETIYVSAGRRGLQIRVRPEDILELTGGLMADLT